MTHNARVWNESRADHYRRLDVQHFVFANLCGGLIRVDAQPEILENVADVATGTGYVSSTKGNGSKADGR